MYLQLFSHKQFEKSFSQSVLLAMLSCLLILGWNSALKAQSTSENALKRVSTAERSDGKGHVVRFHLSNPVDSFRVYQPSTDLIQMSLYSQNVDTAGIKLPEESSTFDEISFYNIPVGLGVDIYIKEGQYYEGQAYHDAASSDFLLAMTQTDKEELEILTKDLKPIVWSRFTVDDESLLIGDLPTDSVATSGGTYERVKNKLKFDVLVLDPGHGGHDPGSIGYRGVQEKKVALQIAKRVGGYVNEYLPDVKVVYTRENDEFVDLYERGPIANKAEGDLFVSIHANNVNTRLAYGTETYFLGPTRTDSALQVMQRENTIVNPDSSRKVVELTQEELLVYELTNSGYMATSEKIAGMIQHQFDERAKRRSRGVKQAGFVVLYTASMPGVLVETGFISNPSEARYLTTEYGQSIIASAIFRAIRNYKEQYEKSQHLNTK